MEKLQICKIFLKQQSLRWSKVWSTFVDQLLTKKHFYVWENAIFIKKHQKCVVLWVTSWVYRDAIMDMEGSINKMSDEYELTFGKQ